MRYFEGFNNLYSEISLDEATGMTDRMTDISEMTVRYISKWDWKYPYRIAEDRTPPYHKIISGDGWFFREYDDSWYVVGVFLIVNRKRDMKYYRCDNIEGLKQVLSGLEIIK